MSQASLHGSGADLGSVHEPDRGHRRRSSGDAAFSARLVQARDRGCCRTTSTAHGALQEWVEDFDAVRDRSPAHLVPVRPLPGPADHRRHDAGAVRGRARGARTARRRRTGWSLAWKVNCWARLRDGDHAYRLLSNLLRLVEDSESASRTAASTPTSSTRIRPSRSTATSASSRASSRCCCRATPGVIDLLPALAVGMACGTGDRTASARRFRAGYRVGERRVEDGHRPVAARRRVPRPRSGAVWRVRRAGARGSGAEPEPVLSRARRQRANRGRRGNGLTAQAPGGTVLEFDTTRRRHVPDHGVMQA